MKITPTLYQQYLKARYQHYWTETAASAWRSVQYNISEQVRRKLSPSYAQVEKTVRLTERNYGYTICDVTFSLSITNCEPYGRESFEGTGRVEAGGENCRHGHDRNDKYWVLAYYQHGRYTVLEPDDTWLSTYRYYLPKHGKARAADLATAWRDSQIKWAVEEYENPEAEHYVQFKPEGEDDWSEEEYFYDSDLTSIYDWVASKIDSIVSERRQAA